MKRQQMYKTEEGRAMLKSQEATLTIVDVVIAGDN